jgi:acyl-CoA thioester hydrolase
MSEHTFLVRVYYADTDALGIVYHANYLRYFEAARIEFLRARKIALTSLLQEYGVQFAVVTAAVQYLKPARFDNQLCVVSRIIKMGSASITYQQDIYLSDRGGDLLCSAEIKLVTVDQNMRPQAIPDALKKEIM